jgi:hypothetical protein
MKNKNKQKNNALLLQEKINSRINTVRARWKEREQKETKQVGIILFILSIAPPIGFVFAIVSFCRDIAVGNPQPNWDLLVFLFLLTLFTLMVIFLRRVFLDNPDGKIVQGNAISKWTRIARVSRGSFLRYALGEKKSKFWEHGEIFVLPIATIVFSLMGLGFFGIGCRVIVDYQNPVGLLVGMVQAVVGLFFCVVVGLIWYYVWGKAGADFKSMMRMRTFPKTAVETDQFPLIIGEEKRFFIRQYCKKADEFFGCTADISLVLIEEEKSYPSNEYTGFTKTRERAKRSLYEQRFDSVTGNSRYEFLFTVLLPADDYVPTTQARFKSAALGFEWFVRVEICSKSDSLFYRDFPVVLSYR